LEGAGHFQIALKADAASGETAAPVTNIFETNKYVDSLVDSYMNRGVFLG
jgi:hypothetical protein